MAINLSPGGDEMVGAVAEALARELPTTRTLITGTRAVLSDTIRQLHAKKAELQRAIAAARAELRQVTETIDGLEPAVSKLSESEA